MCRFKSLKVESRKVYDVKKPVESARYNCYFANKVHPNSNFGASPFQIKKYFSGTITQAIYRKAKGNCFVHFVKNKRFNGIKIDLLA